MALSRRFPDRAEAGRRLAELIPESDGDPVVLGLARGGVPVAAEVARALHAPLDVLVVRKVGHPAQPEYALGAVSEDGVALPEGLPPELVDPQREQAQSQAQRLRAGRERLALEVRDVIVVDDGLATGRSMTAAIEGVARQGAARVVAAVPVASGPGMRALAERCEVYAVLVVEPPEFFAVGQFYVHFEQVSDEEVGELLRRAA